MVQLRVIIFAVLLGLTLAGPPITRSQIRRIQAARVPHLNPNSVTNADPLRKCVTNSKLAKTPCLANLQGRKRTWQEIESEDEETGACLAADFPDYVDIYRRETANGIFKTVTKNSVSTDYLAFKDQGRAVKDPPAPLKTYTVVHDDTLNIDLPVAIKARIDDAAVKSVVNPRQSGAIESEVPSLTEALRNIRWVVGDTIYDVGHMVAFKSGGVDASFNFAPQSSTLNRGLWLSMEKHIRSWVESNSPYGFVDMTIVIYYDEEEKYLPVSFGVDLAYYYSEGRIASVCNDMMYFNHGRKQSKAITRAPKRRRTGRG